MWFQRIVWLACVVAAPVYAAPAPSPSLEEIVIALNGPDVDHAVQAAGTLGARPEPAAHAALLDALAWGAPAKLALVVIPAVGVHATPADVAALARYALHRNPDVRTAALAELAHYSEAAAGAAIAQGLHDTDANVRAAAAQAAAKGHVRVAIEPLFALLALGEEPAALALAQLADPELVRRIGDQLGHVPDATLAHCLGAILARSDFGPDAARVEVVHALGKVDGPEADRALAAYIEAAPKQAASRAEAQKLAAARGGK